MTPLLPNKWHLRRVADSNAKACWICYKPSASVLITPDSKDFFYVCTGHLKDGSFCTPDASEAAASKAKQDSEDLEREKQRVIAEFEEKKKAREKRKAERKKNKDKKEEKDSESKKEEKNDDDEEKKDEEEKDKKVKELEQKNEVGSEDGPRVFELKKAFYSQRIERIRQAEMAKRNRERLKNPTTFPSVPSGNPGGP